MKNGVYSIKKLVRVCFEDNYEIIQDNLVVKIFL